MSTTSTALGSDTVDRIRRAHRILLALAVALAPALQVTGMFLHPPLAEDPAGQLDIVAADPTLWFVTHVISASAAALFILAGPALASLAQTRGAVLATAGAVLTVLGGSALAIAFGAEAHLLSVASDPSLDHEAMAALAELEPASPAAMLIMIGLPLTGLGQILLAAGLLRSQAVPWWAPTLVLVGLVASLAGGPPGSLLGPILMLPAIAGYLALAISMTRR